MYALFTSLQQMRQQMSALMASHVRSGREKLEGKQKILAMLSPGMQLRSVRQQLIEREERMQLFMQQHLERERRALEMKREQLKSLSPQNMLASGSALLLGSDGSWKRSAAQLADGEEIRLILSDGRADARILSVQKEEII